MQMFLRSQNIAKGFINRFGLKVYIFYELYPFDFNIHNAQVCNSLKK